MGWGTGNIEVEKPPTLLRRPCRTINARSNLVVSIPTVRGNPQHQNCIHSGRKCTRRRATSLRIKVVEVHTLDPLGEARGLKTQWSSRKNDCGILRSCFTWPAQCGRERVFHNPLLAGSVSQQLVLMDELTMLGSTRFNYRSFKAMCISMVNILSRPSRGFDPFLLFPALARWAQVSAPPKNRDGAVIGGRRPAPFLRSTARRSRQRGGERTSSEIDFFVQTGTSPIAQPMLRTPTTRLPRAMKINCSKRLRFGHTRYIPMGHKVA